MQRNTIRDTLREEIVCKSIQILRSHGKSEKEIREMMLKNFSIEEKTLDITDMRFTKVSSKNTPAPVTRRLASSIRAITYTLRFLPSAVLRYGPTLESPHQTSFTWGRS